jgi:hypothetical protein
MSTRTFVTTTLFSTLMVAACAAPTAGPEQGDSENVGGASAAVGEDSGIHSAVGQCLDVQWGNSADGTPVWMWPCTGGVAQNWYVTPQSEIRIRTLGDKCLTAPVSDAASATIHTCTGSANQKWYLKQDGSIRTSAGNICLDVRYAGTSPGTIVGATGCNAALPGWPAQVWNFGTWASVIGAGGQIPSGQEIRSASGRYRAIMQGDCNLVVYDNTTAIWQSKTYRSPDNCHADMQSDGNLVIYEGGTAIWATNTYGLPGGALVMQDDGNLVIYQSGRPTWASKQGRLVMPPSDTGPSCPGYAGWWCCATDMTPEYGTGCNSTDAFNNAVKAYSTYGAHCTNWVPGACN